MTDAEILALPAGRELDAAIDRYIFGRDVQFERGEPCGWKVKNGLYGHEREPIVWYPNDYVRLDYSPERDGFRVFVSAPDPRVVPFYSTQIVAAKSATDAILATDAYWDCHIHCYGAPIPDCLVVMINWTDAGRRVEGRAATEEEARARAALMAHWRMKG